MLYKMAALLVHITLFGLVHYFLHRSYRLGMFYAAKKERKRERERNNIVILPTITNVSQIAL